MTTQPNNLPNRLFASIELIYAARNVVETRDGLEFVDPLARLSLLSIIGAVNELQKHLDIFDVLGAYCLQQRLKRTDTPMMGSQELVNVITSDYGFYAIRHIVEDLPESGEFSKADVEEAIDQIIATTQECVDHQRRNPGHDEVAYMYPPQDNPELVRVSQARCLSGLQEGAPGREAMVGLIMAHSEGLRHYLITVETQRRKELRKKASEILATKSYSGEPGNPTGLGGS